MKLNTDKNPCGVKRLKTPICLLILALISILILGCAPLPIENWKEEVQLSDGRIIIIERELIFRRGGAEWANNRRGITPAEHRIRFVYPEGSGEIIEWRSLKKSRSWPEVPLIFDFESGHPIVFSIVGVDDACRGYSKYIYKNDLWVEEALPSEGIEVRATNLFLKLGVDMPKFVDMEAKRKDALKYRRLEMRQAGPRREVCG